MSIEARLASVRASVAAAEAAAKRPADSVMLIAVSKKQPIEAVAAAYDAGVRDFGENTAQELRDKSAALAASGRVARWHFVGRLQSNKAQVVAPLAHYVHSVDRLNLLQALNKATGVEPARRLNALIQVNIGQEAQKGGVYPDAVLALAAAFPKYPRLCLQGLMAVPPHDVDPLPYFERMRDLFLQLRRMPYGEEATHLSMGMSGDFSVAIGCGATMVRVGSAIFGERPRPKEMA